MDHRIGLLRRGLVVVAVAALVTVSLVTGAVGQDKKPDAEKPPADKSAVPDKKPAKRIKNPEKHPEKKPAKGAAAIPAFTPEREAAAMKFVRAHHPEVADLLENLRKSRPEQYRRAARELFRASERVSQWQERDAARYELELKAWKINSRIQLLLARSTMSPDMDVEAELKSLLTERIETRLALRRHDREQLAKRLAAVEADIARLESEKDTAVERQFAQMQQNIKTNRERVKPNTGKNAKKPSAAKKKQDERKDENE